MEGNRELMIRMMIDVLRDFKATLYAMELDEQAHKLEIPINSLISVLEKEP